MGYGLLSAEWWALGKIASTGVCDELEYKHAVKNQKSEAGKKGAAAKKAKAEAAAKAAAEAGGESN